MKKNAAARGGVIIALKKNMMLGLLPVALLIMAGCVEKTSVKPEELVRQRVTERWSELIEGKLESAYQYESPEYREIYSYMDYRRTVNGVGSWKKMDVENVACTEDKCIANIRIYATIKLGMGFEAVDSNARAKENWIRHSTSGQWYHISDH